MIEDFFSENSFESSRHPHPHPPPPTSNNAPALNILTPLTDFQQQTASLAHKVVTGRPCSTALHLYAARATISLSAESETFINATVIQLFF